MNDVTNDSRLSEGGREILRKARTQSLLITPMIWGNEVIGMLSVGSRQKNAFTALEARLTSEVVGQMTAIVKITESHEEMIFMLATSAEASQEATLILQRLRALTEALARELGADEEAAYDMGLASILHDVGKIRIGPKEEDVATMRQHTLWGEQFLRDWPGFDLAASIARRHHEHWDGTGYPDGLSGEQIPEAAAIVAVAHAFAEMITEQAHSPAQTLEAAVDQIIQKKGKQFSPQVVEALVRLYMGGRLPISSPIKRVDQAA